MARVWPYDELVVGTEVERIENILGYRQRNGLQEIKRIGFRLFPSKKPLEDAQDGLYLVLCDDILRGSWDDSHEQSSERRDVTPSFPSSGLH